MITIVDYGVGNIQAIANIYTRLGIPVMAASTAAQLSGAERLILPGVGAFDWAMSRLNDSGMRPNLDELVLQRRRPVLGICVGMQMMARRSDEGVLPGLGWVPGTVCKFDDAKFQTATHLPHMGWNDVTPTRPDPLFRTMESGGRFYFLHSYYFEAESEANVIGTTDYSGAFASSVRNDNVVGAQFHPEKSHSWGIQLLKNFAET